MLAILRIAERQLVRNRSELPTLYGLTVNPYSTEITKQEVCAVKKSWKQLSKKSPKLAKEFFKGLFCKHPDYTKLFVKFGKCPDDVLDNEAFIKDHVVGNVLINFGKAVAKLDDPCEVALFSREIGARHIKYCMKPEHFNNARPILFKAIKKLSDDMDCDTKNGWEKALKIVFAGLQKGLQS